MAADGEALTGADGEGLGVLPISDTMLQHSINPEARSLLQPRWVVAQLTVLGPAPGAELDAACGCDLSECHPLMSEKMRSKLPGPTPAHG